MNTTKKKLIIYFIITFGLPVIFGIFMGIAYKKGIDTSIFPLVWMYLPAFGAMAATLFTHEDKGHSVPKLFYYTFSAFAITMVVLCIVSVAVLQRSAALIISVLAMVSCPICFLEILCMKKEKRSRCGLSLIHNIKSSISGILMFIGLYLVTVLLSFALEKVFLGKAEGYGICP